MSERQLIRSITSASVLRLADDMARQPETSQRVAAIADLRRLAAELAEREQALPRPGHGDPGTDTKGPRG